MTRWPVLRVLWPASILFQALVRARAWAYRRGILRQRRLDGVVISVGNLTVGGTGKTPMVMWVVERLLGRASASASSRAATAARASPMSRAAA